MILFALASFAWPSVAGAAPLCAPLASLHSSIKFCEENPRYLPPAAACRDEYRALVARKSAEVRWLLAGQVAKSTDHAQSLKLANTQDVYTSAENLLTALIAQGRQVKAEIEGYADDFVPPIPSWGVGHWKPDRRNPNDPARSLDYYCWAEPMGDMDQIIADVERMLKELEATKAKTVQLHGVTDTRHANLEDLRGRQRDTVGFGSGRSPREASTVTGKIRNDSLETVPGFGGIKAPSRHAEDPWAASKDSFSTISGKSPALAQAGMPGTSLKNGKEAEAPRSLGAALWAEPTAGGPGGPALVGGGQEPSKALALSASDRAPASLLGSQALPHGEPSADSHASELAGTASAASAAAGGGGVHAMPPGMPAGPQASQALVAHEVSLFAAVSRCYRKTSLFRQRF